MTKLSRHKAEQQVDNERWQCVTCSDPREELGEYCVSCRMYWEDCKNGLWTEYEVDLP